MFAEYHELSFIQQRNLTGDFAGEIDFMSDDGHGYSLLGKRPNFSPLQPIRDLLQSIYRPFYPESLLLSSVRVQVFVSFVTV